MGVFIIEVFDFDVVLVWVEGCLGVYYGIMEVWFCVVIVCDGVW